jgi:hypothetical protein
MKVRPGLVYTRAHRRNTYIYQAKELVSLTATLTSKWLGRKGKKKKKTIPDGGGGRGYIKSPSIHLGQTDVSYAAATLGRAFYAIEKMRRAETYAGAKEKKSLHEEEE